jgi:hypothetical protein
MKQSTEILLDGLDYEIMLCLAASECTDEQADEACLAIYDLYDPDPALHDTYRF